MIRHGGAAGSLLLALVAAACSSLPILGEARSTNEKAIAPIVRVAAGETAQGPWRALAYRTSDGWTCLEVVGGPGGTTCGEGRDALLGIGYGSGAPDQGGFITGGSDIPGAAAINVLLDDGTGMRGAIIPVPPPIADPGVNVFVIRLPPGRLPTRVDILDAQGTALESTEF